MNTVAFSPERDERHGEACHSSGGVRCVWSEQSGTPHDVATQTRRAFCIASSSSSEGESGAATTEDPMEAGGSSVEAIVGAAGPSEISDGNVESGVPVVGSPLVGSVVAPSRCVVRSGKLNSFNNHVIYCNSELLLLPYLLRLLFGVFNT